MKNRFSDLFLSKGVNYFSGDLPLQSILEFFSFKGDSDLSDLGKYISEEFVEAMDFIDHYGKPVLQTWSVLGERIDYVRISPEHERILDRLQGFGIIRKMVKGEESLMYHFVSGYVVSDSGVFCTVTLTAQTAYGLMKYGSEDLKSRFLSRFSDQKEPWYGATFYSETQGGSDLGANRTTARKSGDIHLLSGTDKYFASNAGIADSSIVTARVEGSVEGAKGLSVFFVPAVRKDGTANYSIRRLKYKLGTVAVPTGEVEFNDSEAYLIGDPGYGIQVAMEILTISRIDDAISATGIARKAQWEACLYADRRTAFGKRLLDHDLMIKDLVEREADLQASVAVALLAARHFTDAAASRPPYDEDYHLARLLSSIAKNMAAETSADITRYAMEVLGGIGFFEEYPIAKFHRDSLVTSIWEGTSNIQALEMLEVIVKKNGGELLHRFLQGEAGKIKDGEVSGLVSEDIEAIFRRMKELAGSGEIEIFSKELLHSLGNITAAIEMYLMGEKSYAGSGTMAKAARIFHYRHFHPGKSNRKMFIDSREILEWMLPPS